MQNIFKSIFKTALSEVPEKLQTFHKEDTIIYNGFKISKTKDGVFHWVDVRYNDYYEPVDQIITEKILENGFIKTLLEVRHHNDLDKVLLISRDIELRDYKIGVWIKKASEAWQNYNKQTKNIKTNDEIDSLNKREILQKLGKAYNRKKNSFQKKRRVLSEEKEELRKDLIFYEARIKMYNN